MKQYTPVSCALLFAVIACEAKQSSSTNPVRQPPQSDSAEGSDADGTIDPRNKPIPTDGGGTTDGDSTTIGDDGDTDGDGGTVNDDRSL